MAIELGDQECRAVQVENRVLGRTCLTCLRLCVVDDNQPQSYWQPQEPPCLAFWCELVGRAESEMLDPADETCPLWERRG